MTSRDMILIFVSIFIGFLLSIALQLILWFSIDVIKSYINKSIEQKLFEDCVIKREERKQKEYQEKNKEWEKIAKGYKKAYKY